MASPIIAILVAGLAGWIFGAIWYGLLGKVWQRAQGLDPEACKGQKMPLAPMAISFVCEFVMALILSWLLSGLGVLDVMGGAISGLTLGVGFMATSILVNNSFQGRKLMLSLIDGAQWIAVAVIQGVVLVLLS